MTLIGSIREGLDEIFDGILVFEMNRSLRVDIWYIALFHKILQLAVIIWICYGLYTNDSWAYGEQPIADYNMYVSKGSSASIIADSPDFDTTFQYCANASYKYDYSPEYRYGDPPRCVELNTGEATVKGLDHFFFATMFDERHEFGWSCGSAEEASQYQLCVEMASNMGNKAVNTSRGPQCKCSVRQSYYPVAVEHMQMAMEITYTTSSFFGSYNGSTSVPTSSWPIGPQGLPLEVRLYNTTGHNLLAHRYEEPLSNWIAMSLEDLLASCGLALDMPNRELTPDYRTDDVEGKTPRYPRFRTSGVSVEMRVDFRNSDPVAEQKRRGSVSQRLYASLKAHDVRAEITLLADTKKWAGLGPIMAYGRFPSGPGMRSYHKIERYRQGVVFSFVTDGHVLRLNYHGLVLQLVVGLSLLSVAKLLTHTLGFYLLLSRGTRRMLYSKARERVTETSEFATLAMKAAMAAKQFHLFDPDNNKRIDHVDIAKAFAEVEGVSAYEAYKMADLIIETSDTNYVLPLSKRQRMANVFRRRVGMQPMTRRGDVAQSGLDFHEFMQNIEGDAVVFRRFVKDLRDPAKVDTSLLEQIEGEFALKRCLDGATSGRRARVAASDDTAPSSTRFYATGLQMSSPRVAPHAPPESAPASTDEPVKVAPKARNNALMKRIAQTSTNAAPIADEEQQRRAAARWASSSVATLEAPAPDPAATVGMMDRQADAEDKFVLADTSGDGYVDEDELLVLVREILKTTNGARHLPSDARLRAFLQTFRTEAEMPLNLSFDDFVGVYNAIGVAMDEGQLDEDVV